MATERKVHRYSAWLRDEIVYNAHASVKKHGLAINGALVNPRIAALAVRDLLKEYTTTTQLLKAWPGMVERGLAYEFTIEDIEKIIKYRSESESRKRKLKALHEAAPELLEALQTALQWIDAVPSDAVLPTMPGFDRDEVNNIIAKALGEKQ